MRHRSERSRRSRVGERASPAVEDRDPRLGPALEPLRERGKTVIPGADIATGQLAERRARRDRRIPERSNLLPAQPVVERRQQRNGGHRERHGARQEQRGEEPSLQTAQNGAQVKLRSAGSPPPGR